MNTTSHTCPACGTDAPCPGPNRSETPTSRPGDEHLATDPAGHMPLECHRCGRTTYWCRCH